MLIGRGCDMDVRPHWWKLLALGGLLIPSMARADSLIPWPWLESSRYQTWKQERDEQRADWYARRSLDPVGARQKYYKGKYWPPYPRPEGLSMLPSHRYHAAHYWPYPYSCQDRASVAEFNEAQEEAGWIDATTLYEYHFEMDGQTLNRAGRLQLRWIMRNTPEHRRVLHVQAGDNETASNLRMASVHAEALEMVGSELVPPILLRVTAPLGRSAFEVDAIQRAERSTILAPRITPPFNSGGTSGSGSTAGTN